MEKTASKQIKRTANKQINFRVTNEEMEILKVNAELAGLTVPTYCKNTALKVKMKPPVIDKAVGKAILPHISHMGSNINQLAKKANEGGTVAVAELAEIKKEFESLWDYVLTGKKSQKVEQTEIKTEPRQVSKETEKVAKQVDEELFEDVSKVKQSEEKQETPICEYCKTPMEKKRVQSGVNMGRWYWHCPNYRDDDGIHKTNEYIWVK